MSDAVNAAFERSEHLRQQWQNLKREMLAIDPSQPDAAQRRDQLRNQMDQIMNQMTSVLNETKRLIPPHHAAPQEEPIVEARPVQYSAHHKHIIHRTYESSDSSDDSRSDSEMDLPKAQPTKQPKKPPVPQLRVSSPPTSPVADVELVCSPEHQKVVIEAKRTSLAGFTKGLREKLRINDPSPNQQPSAPPPVAISSPITKEKRDRFVQEQMRLERESRRLNRKPERTAADEQRLLEIASSLSRLSSILAETPDMATPCARLTKPAHQDSFDKGQKAKSSAKPPKGKGAQDISMLVSSPVTDDDSRRPFDSLEDSPAHQRQNKPSHGKRKKGWGAFEAGVASSFKAFGRTVRHVAAAASNSRAADPKNDSHSSRVKEKSKTVQNTQDLFSDTHDRIQERGENLENTAEAAEQMADDANDMLAAAKALNQRNKGGFFS